MNQQLHVYDTEGKFFFTQSFVKNLLVLFKALLDFPCCCPLLQYVKSIIRTFSSFFVFTRNH